MRTAVTEHSPIWHVLQLKPNGLKIAETNLARQGYQTLMPMREMSQQSRFGSRSVKRPLFPGYLFICALGCQVEWRPVANTRGVARVVTGTGGQPAELPTQFAEGLMRATAESGMLIGTTEFRTDDTVGVIKGPFAGWLAQVIAADDEGRVRLLIDLLGRKTHVTMASVDLEKRVL